MTIELLQTLSLAAFIVAGILLLASIALFFLLDVPKLYGDISGRTAKKAIDAIRQQNEETGNKAYKPSAVNEARGKLTDKITPSGRLVTPTEGMPLNVGTEKFSTSALTPQSAETTILGQACGETDVLEQQTGETTVFNGSSSVVGQTTLLIQETEEKQVTYSEYKDFTVDVEMSFTGSSEIIE